MVKTSLFVPIAVLSLMMSVTDVFLIANPERRIVEMAPINPLVKEFDTLVLNCTLTSYYKGHCNASNLYVEHSNQEFRYPFIQAITNETAEFRLPNVTIEHNGRFACSFESSCNAGFPGILAAQSIHVARAPLRPFLIGCTVYNWEYLYCTWGPSKSVQDNHTSSARSLKQFLLWQHPSDGDTWNLCPNNTLPEQCFWRSSHFTMTKEYCIQIVVWNSVSPNLTTEVKCLNPEFFVKPKPPTGIRQMAASPDDGRMLGFKWNATTSKQVSLIYRVTVHSKWEVRNFTVINDTSLTVSSVPDTSYDISIVAFPSRHGYSSDETSARFLTAATAPSENPSVMTNFYYANADERAVVLYWQPISERSFCGREFCYCVQNRTSNGCYDCVNDKYSASIGWSGFAIDLRIVSRNHIGLASSPSSAIHVPSNDDLFSGFEVVAEGQENYVSVEWFLEKSSEERKIEAVMFFWCQSESFHVGHCKTPIQWHTVNALQYDFNLTLSESFRPFQFGVSVKLSGGSFSGINWAKNKYTSGKSPGAPRELQVSTVAGKHNELRIQWMEPLHDESKAFIRSFVIFYCPVDDQDECLYGEQSVTVFKYQDHIVVSGIGNIILNDLNSNTKYRIWMFSRAGLSSSASSEYAYKTTTQPWFNPGKIVGIAIGILCAATIVFFGLCVSFRYCDKCRKKFTSGLTVSLPPQRFQLPSTSSEAPMLRDTSYMRHPSQVSTISRDSGHFSFPPSSPAKLPLLAEEYVNLKEKTYTNGGVNRYHTQTAVFCVPEKVPDDECSNGSGLCVTSYKISPVKTECGQTQYILPEQLSQMGNGAVSAKFFNYCACETGNNNVEYCNDLHASDSANIGYTKIEQLPSDIGYTKIEQLPMMVNQGSKLPADLGSSNHKDEDSNLLLSFDHQLGEIGFHSVPAFGHHGQLLVTSNQDRALADGSHAKTEPSAVDDDCPHSVANVAEENVPLYSKQGINGVDSNVSESIISSSEDRSCDNGYLPHNRLFGID